MRSLADPGETALPRFSQFLHMPNDSPAGNPFICKLTNPDLPPTFFFIRLFHSQGSLYPWSNHPKVRHQRKYSVKGSYGGGEGDGEGGKGELSKPCLGFNYIVNLENIYISTVSLGSQGTEDRKGGKGKGWGRRELAWSAKNSSPWVWRLEFGNTVLEATFHVVWSLWLTFLLFTSHTLVQDIVPFGSSIRPVG